MRVDCFQRHVGMPVPKRGDISASGVITGGLFNRQSTSRGDLLLLPVRDLVEIWEIENGGNWESEAWWVATLNG